MVRTHIGALFRSLKQSALFWGEECTSSLLFYKVARSASVLVAIYILLRVKNWRDEMRVLLGVSFAILFMFANMQYYTVLYLLPVFLLEFVKDSTRRCLLTRKHVFNTVMWLLLMMSLQLSLFGRNLNSVLHALALLGLVTLYCLDVQNDRV